MKSKVIVSHLDTLGGSPIFKGTRVPAKILIDYLEAGDSIEEFLEGFPTVSRRQVIAFLEEIKENLIVKA